MFTVHVAIYKKPNKTSASHWALWLEGPGSKSTVHQVGGGADDQDGFFVVDAKETRPDRSRQLDILQACGTIADDLRDTAVSVIQSSPVNNGSNYWNCQDFVIEVLGKLESKCGLQISSDSKDLLRSRKENPQYENKYIAPGKKTSK